ncbi:MAG: AAA family ATPase [Nitrososphaerota archaeon]|jgi:recombinational DNA repair ATPase RecF|nr:AAA family ATPase [Nitrososphaerota archaeon]
MRLLSLEIQNIRGIKNIRLNPNGQNMVVYGPNGTGKSAIVDAVDFLLTGKISRLTGEGANVLTIKQHGCHVDYRDDLKNTVVKAKMQIGNNEVSLERSIVKPSYLKVTPTEFALQVKMLLGFAELGQHILTRRDILAYITTEAGKRAKRVMSLLNLDCTENARSMLVTVKNDADCAYSNASANLKSAEASVLTLLSLQFFSEDTILEKINGIRRALNGANIVQLSVENMKSDLSSIPFRETTTTGISQDEIQSTIRLLRTLYTDKEKITRKETELKGFIVEVKNNKLLSKCMFYESLIRAGIALTDESNVCPLCGRRWEGNFQVYLAEKEKETEIAKNKQTSINEIAKFLNQQLSLIKNYIATCVTAKKQFKLSIPQAELDSYLSELNSWQQILSNPFENLENAKWASSFTETLTAPFVETKLIAPLEEALSKIEPNNSVQQDAWDTLTKMELRWRDYLDGVKKEQDCELFRKRATVVLERFEVAQKFVLESTYDDVQSDFEKYYKTMHGNDETDFTSELSRNGAELNFEVEFYNRGKFPPHALHSEGHQDSMGLALFFALNAYLVKNAMELVVLDDVVMSIDSGHRRGVCGLLKTFQQSRQFIITTHDTAWAKQLRSEGIIKKQNMIHFANWNVSTGPIFELELDLWDLLTDDLNKNAISVAAARLRRNAENYFDDVCDNLHAKIDYKGTHQWELGDYAPAAIGAYKKYLKKAKDNANKTHDRAKCNELEEVEAVSKDIIDRSQVEQWIINDNVHYNRWENFSKEDFMPVVNAYKKLFELFSCSKCGSMLQYMETTGDNHRTIVSCTCGSIFWNVG